MSDKILSSSHPKDESDLSIPFSTENICQSSPNSPNLTEPLPNQTSPQNQSTDTLSEMSNSSLSVSRESCRRKYLSPIKHRYSTSTDYNGASPNSVEANPCNNSTNLSHKNSLPDVSYYNKLKRSTTEDPRSEQFDKISDKISTGPPPHLTVHSTKQPNYVFSHGINSYKNIGLLNSTAINPHLISTPTLAPGSLDSRSALAALSLAYSSILTKGMGNLPMGLEQHNSNLIVPGTHCPPMNNKLFPNFLPPNETPSFLPISSLTRVDPQLAFKHIHESSSIPSSVSSTNSKLTNESAGLGQMNISSLMNNLMSENFDRWQQFQQSAFANNVDPHLLTCYNGSGCPVELSGTNRRKNATRETTSMLKAWLNEHRKNPYPTKGEKIMLALITKMSLTQVSTWFANARRRLKKENKVTWNVRGDCSSDNGRDAESIEDDEEITERDLEGMNGLESLKHFLLSEKGTDQLKDSMHHLDALRSMTPEDKRKSFNPQKGLRILSDDQDERLNSVGSRKRSAFDSESSTEESRLDAKNNSVAQKPRKIWSLVEMAHDQSDQNSGDDISPSAPKENDRLQSPKCWKSIVQNLSEKPLHNSSLQPNDASLLSETLNKINSKDGENHFTDGFNNINDKVSTTSPAFGNSGANPVNSIFSPAANLAAFYFYYQLQQQQQQQQQQQVLDKGYPRHHQHASPIQSHSDFPNMMPNYSQNKESMREEALPNSLFLPFLPDSKESGHISNNNSRGNEDKPSTLKTQARSVVSGTEKL